MYTVQKNIILAKTTQHMKRITNINQDALGNLISDAIVISLNQHTISCNKNEKHIYFKSFKSDISYTDKN